MADFNVIVTETQNKITVTGDPERIVITSISPVVAAAGAEDFIDLGDVPASYTGEALKYVRVNAGETGLEFSAVVAGTNTFGTIATPSGTSPVADSTTDTLNLAVGTTGTDFNITGDSSTDTVTFNIPTASATNRGALSSSDWSTFNNKVSGPVSSTDNAIARFDGVTGKVIQDSAVTVADTTGQLTINGNLQIGSTVGGATIQIATGDMTFDANGGDIIYDTGSETYYGNTNIFGTFSQRFFEDDNTNYVAFKGAATIAANITWTLPNVDSTGTQYLRSDGAGTLSWGTPSTISGLTDNRMIRANGTSDIQNSGFTIDDNDIIDLSAGQVHSTIATLTDGANIAWNLNTRMCAQVTLGGNRTIDAPTNMKSGATYMLKVIQDGTGGRTLSWPSSIKWTDGIDPVLSTGANAVDCFIFFSDGTSMFGSVIGFNMS